MPKKSSAKNTKSSSKLAKTLAWFKPTSAKKGALLFVIAFAVIGGSLMAYKSFAQTVYVVHYPGTDLDTQLGCNTGHCNVVNDDSGSRAKSPVKAVKLYGDGTYPTAVTGFDLIKPWSLYAPTQMVATRLCIEVRTSKSAYYGKFTMKIESDGYSPLNPQPWGGDSGLVKIPGGTTEYGPAICTLPFNVPGGHRSGTVFIKNYGTSDLYIRSVSLQI